MARPNLNQRPISYTRSQARQMIELADRLTPDLARCSGELESTVRLVIEGRKDPTPALLDLMGLCPKGEGYTWNPR